MKLRFKVQPYQTHAVESVINCFTGQPRHSGALYRIDPGLHSKQSAQQSILAPRNAEQTGFRNAPIQLEDAELLKNIQQVQKAQNLPLSSELVPSASCPINLDVEMETGTGKTYCYIKTIFEMHKCYGWTKFIVIVPSIAIREGTLKSLEITAEHFAESYHKKARFFSYNSKQLHHLEGFSSDASINVMVINIQAFNATGKDNRRIYEELDDFQSRRPIDVISSNHPILILDEPQKMEGRKTLEALAKFNPLMILRYSATHRTTHNKIHRLDALDAYDQKLVKKIAVRGITTVGLAGTNAYLYLESIDISEKAPVARIDMEIRRADGEIKRIVKQLGSGRDLHTESNQLDQYRGFVIAQIDATQDTVEFTNGHILNAGDATGDITETGIQRIQIRETIKAHLEREEILFAQDIKVLSLFFIDEVSKYRDYSREDECGEYARIFEEEYKQLREEHLNELNKKNASYRAYLQDTSVNRIHSGYFSIDRKTKKLTNPRFGKRGENAGLSDDVDAYDLILKNKEQLLSFEEPVRFIFSHSALREGWDNPNVFVMCMLKHSDSTISRRQEVGRGLRISVNQSGSRTDDPSTVHDVNILTVVAGESYAYFVKSLQREISDSLSSRPRKADETYFTGKLIHTENETINITPEMARHIHRYMIKNGYIDNEDLIAEAYHEAKATETLAALPEDIAPYSEQIFELIDGVFSDAQLPKINNERRAKTNQLNENFEKAEFKALWGRINRKAIYRVDFDSSELITNSIKELDETLEVPSLLYIVQRGEQAEKVSPEKLMSGQAFPVRETETHYGEPTHSTVKYDLLEKIAEETKLKRATIAEILGGIKASVFAKFKQNPEKFITESSRIINEQKASIIIERLSYNCINDTHSTEIFTAGQYRQNLTRASEKLKKHIYDYAIIDSGREKDFVKDLDTSQEVVVYAKLPRGFFIPTPVGKYNPDWAICFEEGKVKHIYFVAETKGSMSSMELRKIEQDKIDYARKFFDEISQPIDSKQVKYNVVTNYVELMRLVKPPA